MIKTHEKFAQMTALATARIPQWEAKPSFADEEFTAGHFEFIYDVEIGFNAADKLSTKDKEHLASMAWTCAHAKLDPITAGSADMIYAISTEVAHRIWA